MVEEEGKSLITILELITAVFLLLFFLNFAYTEESLTDLNKILIPFFLLMGYLFSFVILLTKEEGFQKTFSKLFLSIPLFILLVSLWVWLFKLASYKALPSEKFFWIVFSIFGIIVTVCLIFIIFSFNKDTSSFFTKIIVIVFGFIINGATIILVFALLSGYSLNIPEFV